MGAIKTTTAALVLVLGAFACERKSEPPGNATMTPPPAPAATSEVTGSAETTGAKIEHGASDALHDTKVGLEEAKDAAVTEADKAKGAIEGNKDDAAKAEADKSDAEKMKECNDLKAKHATAKPKYKKPAAAAAASTAPDKDKDQSSENQSSQTEQPFVVEESTTVITSAPVEPAPPAPPKNTSTTLGDGSSGMYTGGKGAYGGTATYGTGAGASTNTNEKK